LKVLIGDAAKNHAAEPSIAYRKGFDPFLGGLFVPECERRIRGKTRLAQYDWKQEPENVLCLMNLLHGL
jgi:hypothetical protein